MPSLTRDEAAQRAAAVHVTAYELDFDLTIGDQIFRSESRIQFAVTADATSTFVDIRPERLVRVTLDGRELESALVDDGRMALTGLPAGPHELIVVADLAYTNTSQGLHRFTDPADGETYVYSAMFLDQASSGYACFDQPDLKAPFTVTMSVDPRWVAVSNAAGTQVSPGRWEFATTEPLATYFTVVAAGPYHRVESVHDGIPLAVYGRASLAASLDAQAPEILAVTAACFDRYHELFGVRYPFGKYDQAFVPEFSAGAMENPGCVTFRDDFIFTSAVTDAEREHRAVVIAHEMAHMWFGDLVTMRWWDDLWLNESFANYLGYRVTAEATEFTGAWTEFAVGEKAWGYAADQRASSHPVAPETVASAADALLNFDGISYAKGASVLRQLVAWLGDDAFLAGLRAHITAHAFANATLADLLDALAAASGRDVAAWARVWLRTAGVSTLRPEVRLDSQGRYESVAIGQTAPAARPGSEPVLRPHRITVATGVAGDGGALRLRDIIGVSVQGARTAVDALTGLPEADLLLVNYGDLTYAKIRLDPASMSRLAGTLPSIGDRLTRALLWGAAWDMTRDSELPATEFISLCGAALPDEEDVAIFAKVAQYAVDHAIDRYLTPGQRLAARQSLAAACRAALAGAQAGSGRQLVAARWLIRCAGQDDAGWMRSWLDDPAAAPAGLVVDRDLRWALHEQLAAHGALSAEEIAAEYAGDRTLTGGTHAARCRALRPDPEAKARAWARLIDDDSVSGRLLAATADGFWRAGQDDLTRSYVQRYVTDMPRMAGRRVPDVAEQIARLAYPRYEVSDAAYARLAAMAARNDLTPALRRELQDGNDDLARALAARALASRVAGAQVAGA